MKKYLLFSLFFFIACFSYSQESRYTDIFDNMQGVVVNNDTLLQANGYLIRIKESIVPKSLFGEHKNAELVDLFKAGNNEKERTKYNLDNKDLLYNIGDMVVFRSDLEKRQYTDSIASQDTKYIYRIKKYHLKSIEFLKKGESDSTYQLNVVNAIRHEGIPKSIIITSADTIDFLGKKIGLPIDDSYDTRSYNITKPKSLPNRREYDASWDSYHTQEDAIRENEYNVSDFIKDNNRRIISEGKDTILFQNRRILADRFDMKGYNYIKTSRRRVHTSLTSSYFIQTNVDNKPITLNVTVSYDSIPAERKLPPFIEENFFQLISKGNIPHIEPDTISAPDTVFIAQKKKMPIWTIHTKNTKTNGLSLGLATMNGYKNVNTNGIRAELFGSSILPMIVFPIALMPTGIDLNSDFSTYKEDNEEREVNSNNRFDKTNGISLSLLGSATSDNIKINGIQIAGFWEQSLRMNGLSIIGIRQSGHISNGISIGGFGNQQSVNNGILIGGVWSRSHQTNGLQVSAISNVCFDMKGVQIGAYNEAREVKGLQIGIFNKTGILKGFQIGIWNKNKKRSFPIINWGF